MFRPVRPVSRALAAIAAFAAIPMMAIVTAQVPRVEIKPDEAGRRVDITVDGKPFTSYIYPTTLKKPTLWPIVTAKGGTITRGFPPKKGERVDHPHHVGLWFNHGDVNGFDFWNNSEAIRPDQAKKYGTIVHRKVGQVKSGAGQGELNVEMDWVAGDGATLLRENTKFIFGANDGKRTIDRITTLTTLDKQVVFRDNKEGVLGLRVTRALEHPATKPEVFADASGKATPVPVLDNTGVTGMYTSSEGLKGDAVWGTRGRWTFLSATLGTEPVTVAMLDHPSNPGYPTYWHARGYGLFAANMLGNKVFSNGKEELNLTLEPGKSVTFKHRIVIVSGATTAEAIESEYKAFTAGS
jgi:hypothetical protein